MMGKQSILHPLSVGERLVTCAFAFWRSKGLFAPHVVSEKDCRAVTSTFQVELAELTHSIDPEL
jgi:hypothetical protein